MANIRRIGPCGGTGGGQRNVDAIINNVTRILKITVWHGDAIDALEVRYKCTDVSEQSSGKWGGGGGARLSENYLDEDEYVISVKGHVGLFKFPWYKTYATVLRSLSFVTNKRTLGLYGVEDGTPFELAANNGQIVGFFGQSGDLLDAIGAYIRVNIPQRPRGEA